MVIKKGDLILVKGEEGYRHWEKGSVLMYTGRQDSDDDYIVKQICNGGYENHDEYDGEIQEYLSECTVINDWDEYFEFM